MSKTTTLVLSFIAFIGSYLLIDDWKLFVGLMLFGWGMNLQNKINRNKDD